MTNSSRSITGLLLKWRNGDKAAFDDLIPMVYQELRRLAKHYIGRQRPGQMLQITSLINEAYLRLVDHKNMRWQNRAHFFAVAAQAMRRILVDQARSRFAAKRGGLAQEVSLDGVAVIAQERAAELIALDDALTELAELDQRKSQIVEMKYFGGLSIEETAEVLGISTATVVREWRSAKRLLLRAMSRNDKDEPGTAEANR